MKEVRTIDTKLVENLRQAKTILYNAQKLVEDAESAIYLAAGPLPEKGTVHCTGVKISVGFYEKWDNDALQKAEEKWTQFSNLQFPFKKVYKPDGKAISYMRENAATAYAAIEAALTLTNRKPTFELLEEKE